MKRRKLLVTGGVGLFALPLSRIAYLKSQDNLLPPVDSPDLVLVDGWLLDMSDLENETANDL